MVMVVLELIFWTLAFFGIWLNEIWTFLTLGVLGVSALFIGVLHRESAERQAQELFASSKKGRDAEIEKKEEKTE